VWRGRQGKVFKSKRQSKPEVSKKGKKKTEDSNWPKAGGKKKARFANSRNEKQGKKRGNAQLKKEKMQITQTRGGQRGGEGPRGGQGGNKKRGKRWRWSITPTLVYAGGGTDRTGWKDEEKDQLNAEGQLHGQSVVGVQT